MGRDVRREDESEQGEEMIRDGNLIIEERMNRREGLVEYEGDVVDDPGTGGFAVPAAASDTGAEAASPTPAMQAGATILGGTGNTALVDDGATGAGSETTGTVGSGTDPLSMSTDNTASGRMMGNTVEAGPITMVREKMKVVDANGEELGKVDQIKMGDPAAATTAGEDLDSTAGGDVVVGAPVGGLGGSGGVGLAGGATGIFGGGDDPAVAEPMRSELLRMGYVKVDGKGWFDTDHYARADQIASVANDTVTLSVGKDALAST